METDTPSKTRWIVWILGVFIFYAFYINFCTGRIHPGKLVTREEYGKEWPFTVAKGYVYSIGRAAIFETESGHRFQLNGVASMQGFKAIDPIWRYNPEIYGTRINIGPFIRLALETPR